MDLLLEIGDLRKYFVVKGGFFTRQKAVVKAVDGITFDVRRGEIFALVGESGCGKSTTARLIMRLLEADGGEILFDGVDVLKLKGEQLKHFRSEVQIAFQDPYMSLNPRMTLEHIIAFNAVAQGHGHQDARQRAWQLMEQVGLDPSVLARRYPHELSGGQRQRINIARALVLQPKLLILDEPVSSLDNSVQSQVLNELNDLKEQLGLTYILVSHDLNVVGYLADRVAVMYLGQIVEIADADEFYRNPTHPYSQALLASVPSTDPDARRLTDPPLKGQPPSPIDPPSGCRFRTRCPHAMDVCTDITPPLKEATNGHWVACHLYEPQP